MADEISIALKMTDNLAEASGKMKASLASMKTDLSGLQTQLTTLRNTKFDLQVNLDKAKTELNDAKRAFNDLASAENEARLQSAQSNYANVQDQMHMVNRTISSTRTEIEKTAGSMKSFDNYASRDFLSGLQNSQMFNLLGSSVASAGTALLTSGMGSSATSAANSLLSGISSGLSIGMMTGNPLLGLGVGAASGIVSAATEVYKTQSDAMTSYVSSLYDSVTQATSDALEAGSATAASRETTLISFTTLMGSADNASSYLGKLKTLANTTPFLFDDLTSLSKTLMQYGIGQSSLIPDLTAIGDTGAALGMSTSDMSTVATGLGRMNSTDKVTLEYLNLLSERGINAVGWLAQRDNISTADVYDRISKGTYSGQDTVAYLIDKMQELYGGSMELQSQTFEGLTSTVQGLTDEVTNAMGEGYNNERKSGLTSQVDFLGSTTGQAWQQMNSIIGYGQGYGENLQDEIKRQIYAAVLSGTATTYAGFDDDTKSKLTGLRSQYTAALQGYANGTDEEKGNAAATMETIQQTMDGMAQASYDASDYASRLTDSNNDLIDALQEFTTQVEAYTNQLSVSQNKSEGITLFGKTYVDTEAADNGSLAVTHSLSRSYGSKSGYASGLSRVGRTGMYLLHEGEKVSRAAENTGSGGGVVIQMGDVTVREKSDIDEMAEAFYKKLMLAKMAGSM